MVMRSYAQYLQEIDMLTQPKGYKDINHGVDFERARERLNDATGRAWRIYLETRKDPEATSAQIEAAKAAYTAADNRYRALKPTQTTEIEDILDGAHAGAQALA